MKILSSVFTLFGHKLLAIALAKTVSSFCFRLIRCCLLETETMVPSFSPSISFSSSFLSPFFLSSLSSTAVHAQRSVFHIFLIEQFSCLFLPFSKTHIHLFIFHMSLPHSKTSLEHNPCSNCILQRYCHYLFPHFILE